MHRAVPVTEYRKNIIACVALLLVYVAVVSLIVGYMISSYFYGFLLP